MALNSSSIEKTAGWYGFLTAIAFIVYSLILHYTNLTGMLGLRGIYIVIMAVGVVMSIASLRRGSHGKMNYLQGIGVGAITALVSSLIFGLITLMLIEFVDESLINVLKSDDPITENATASSAFMVITMIGFAGGSIIAFIAMQFFKRPDHKIIP